MRHGPVKWWCHEARRDDKEIKRRGGIFAGENRLHTLRAVDFFRHSSWRGSEVRVGIDEHDSSRANNRFDASGLRIHMIGIGGCGMSGAGRILAERGAVVSGSDLNSFEGMGSLVQRGVKVSIGHRAEQVAEDVDLVVISAAIPMSNPELQIAHRRGVRVIKYAELLGELSRGYRGIAIAGTHGKSTTTAMVAHIFRESGLDPTFVIGAQSEQLGGSSAAGTGPHFVVESCEYGRSFLNLKPHAAAILNIESDHLDCYKNFEAIVEAFSDFARLVDVAGIVICNGEDRWAMEASAASGACVETFGFDESVDWRAINLAQDFGRFSFDVQYRRVPVLSTRLEVPGQHNVRNVLAAVALAYHCGAACHRISEAVTSFDGIGRRLTLRGRGSGVQIVDDYAHHPTEIRVTIEAVRSRYVPKRIIVVFQPHQYDRTRHFLDDFAASFHDVDEVVVPDVYGARESERDGVQVGSKELVSRICEKGGRACYLPTLSAAAEHVVAQATDGDLVVTMGAGDVWKVADELVQRIC